MLIISKVANVFSCQRDDSVVCKVVCNDSFSVFNRVYIVVSIRVGVEYTMAFLCQEEIEYSTTKECYICRATMRPPRPSSTAECLRLIARLRGEPASAASWEPRPPFEATQMD